MKSSYDTIDDDKRVVKKKYTCRNCIILICIFLCIINLIALFLMIYTYKYNNINLAAKTYHSNHHHHHLSCDDMYIPKKNMFGCCNVTDYSNHVYNLSFNYIVCRDKSCSNCPKYDNLVEKYSEYIREYPNYYNLIDCNIHKCCKINTIIIPLLICPKSTEIVNKYNQNYSSPWQDLIVLFILGLILLLFSCSISNKGKKGRH